MNKERPSVWQSMLLALAILLIIYAMSSCSKSGKRNLAEPHNVKSTRGHVVAIHSDGSFKVDFEAPMIGVRGPLISEWFYSSQIDTLRVGTIIKF